MGIIVESFDVGQGDCFLIRVSNAAGKYFNLMVDCGKKNMAAELENALNGQRLNGIVVTHVDNDHIVGVIDFLESYDPDNPPDFLKNVFIIYNKYDESLITYEKGNKLYEEIKARLSQKMLLKSYARNYNRENKSIERRRRHDELPVHILSKGQRSLMNAAMLEREHVYITLLSPDIDTLKKLMRDWKKVTENSSLKNQSSIAFLLEFNGQKVLMTGDGYVDRIYAALKEFKDVDHIDYIKLSHHGSAGNNKEIEKFADEYRCKKFGVTMKEQQTGEKKHPHRDVIDRLIQRCCQIFTSTDYICTDPADSVRHIIKQAKIYV